MKNHFTKRALIFIIATAITLLLITKAFAQDGFVNYNGLEPFKGIINEFVIKYVDEIKVQYSTFATVEVTQDALKSKIAGWKLNNPSAIPQFFVKLNDQGETELIIVVYKMEVR